MTCPLLTKNPHIWSKVFRFYPTTSCCVNAVKQPRVWIIHDRNLEHYTFFLITTKKLIKIFKENNCTRYILNCAKFPLMVLVWFISKLKISNKFCIRLNNFFFITFKAYSTCIRQLLPFYNIGNDTYQYP